VAIAPSEENSARGMRAVRTSLRHASATARSKANPLAASQIGRILASSVEPHGRSLAERAQIAGAVVQALAAIPVSRAGLRQAPIAESLKVTVSTSREQEGRHVASSTSLRPVANGEQRSADRPARVNGQNGQILAIADRSLAADRARVAALSSPATGRAADLPVRVVVRRSLVLSRGRNRADSLSRRQRAVDFRTEAVEVHAAVVHGRAGHDQAVHDRVDRDRVDGGPADRAVAPDPAGHDQAAVHARAAHAPAESAVLRLSLFKASALWFA
jgi:hypothetical protein